MSDIVRAFYDENFNKIQMVYMRQARSPKHDEFFKKIYNINKWTSDETEHSWLRNYIKANYDSLTRSLAQIGSTHVVTNRAQETNLRKGKNFFDLNEDITEDSDIVDALEAPYKEDKSQIHFKRPEPNQNPKTSNGRNDLDGYSKIITPYININDDRLSEIPSSARNFKRFFDLSLDKYDYASYFKPHPTKTLYKPKQAKKFYGPRGTWMFDLMYFKDYNVKQHRKTAVYLIGININTRYAVCKRVNGKSVKDLIPAFEAILSEVKDFKYLIFDGEKGIVSKQFEKFCKSKNINVRITYPGIHTQTAPIDRLCRTVRDDFMKYYMSNQNKIVNITKTTNPWLQSKKRKHDILTEVIKVRRMFNGEDKQKLAPIPSRYAVYWDNEEGEEVYYVLTDEDEKVNLKKYLKKFPLHIGFSLAKYDEWQIQSMLYNHEEEDILDDFYQRFKYTRVEDELEEVIDAYNRRPHNGLIKLFKYAQATFGEALPFNLQIDKVTPITVNLNPQLEYVIIEYCKYYNSEVAQPSYEFKIGEKVKVYDCFTSNRGSLLNRWDFLIGDWEIHSKDNEIYGVVDKDNGQILHVSKYMIVPK